MSPPLAEAHSPITTAHSQKAGPDGRQQPQGSQWAALPQGQLYRLITDQIPRFRERPYLADERALQHSLARGLTTSLSGDFCWSLCFSPRFIAALCYEGLLPICCELGGGTGLYVLLPKLHAERCVLSFDALHVPKKVRKRARRYVLTCGRAFDAVLDGCIRQHGESWLYPPLQTALRALTTAAAPAGCGDSSPSAVSSSADVASGEVAGRVAGGCSLSSHRPERGSGGGGGEAPTGGDLSRRSSGAEQSEPQPQQPQPQPQPPGRTAKHSSAPSASPSSSSSSSSTAAAAAASGSGDAAGGASYEGGVGVRALSFELWRDGELVAGELGCAVGASYTSFSGFHAESGAGAAQLAMTASLLRDSGFRFWDLGQEHAYKLAMGATMVPRPQFLAALHAARAIDGASAVDDADADADAPPAAATLDALLRRAGGRVDGRVLSGRSA